MIQCQNGKFLPVGKSTHRLGLRDTIRSKPVLNLTLLHEPTEGGVPKASHAPSVSTGRLNGRWLKLADAAHSLGVSEITIRRRVRLGRLQHEFRDGRYYVFIPEGVGVELLGGPMFAAENPRSTLPAPAPAPGPRVSSPGPSPEQVAEILSIELREKEKELAGLRRALADQITLNEALEVALAEALEGSRSA